MGKRRASVDAMITGFDDAISAWVDANVDGLVETYGMEKVESLADNLGDHIYADIELDPSHLKRFIGFYVSDNKMQDLVEEIMSDVPRAASSPSEVAWSLRNAADLISSSESPSSSHVVDHLKALLRHL